MDTCIKKLDTFTCTYGYIWIDMDKMYQEVGYFYLHIWIHMEKCIKKLDSFTCTYRYLWIKCIKKLDTFTCTYGLIWKNVSRSWILLPAHLDTYG